MFSAKSKFCVRLVANLAWAVAIPLVALPLLIGYRNLTESTKDIARAKRVRSDSEEVNRQALNDLLDRAIDTSKKKDALFSDIVHVLGVSYAILLFMAVRNMRIGFALDRSRQTVLHHCAGAFAKIFRGASLALRGEAEKDGALADAKSISGVQLEYIERQRGFAHEFRGYDRRSGSAFNLTIAALEIFRARQDETPNLELRAEIPDEEIIVRAHEELVGCIIDNLLGNATKYTDKGSVTLSLSRRGRNVFISVADTGRGIPRKTQREMYKPHVRDRSALDVDGSGWGLHEVKCAVRNYGGRIKCESEVGKGTTFTVTLPIAVTPPSTKTCKKDDISLKINDLPPPPRKVEEIARFNVETYSYAA